MLLQKMSQYLSHQSPCTGLWNVSLSNLHAFPAAGCMFWNCVFWFPLWTSLCTSDWWKRKNTVPCAGRVQSRCFRGLHHLVQWRHHFWWEACTTLAAAPLSFWLLFTSLDMANAMTLLPGGQVGAIWIQPWELQTKAWFFGLRLKQKTIFGR